jgi:hypothetical protein
MQGAGTGTQLFLFPYPASLLLRRHLAQQPIAEARRQL